MVNWGGMLQTGANNPLTTGYQSPLPEEEQLKKIKEMMMNRRQPLSVMQSAPSAQLAMPEATSGLQRLLSKILEGAGQVTEPVKGYMGSRDWGKILPGLALGTAFAATPGFAQGDINVTAARNAQAALDAEAAMKRKQQLMDILKEFDITQPQEQKMPLTQAQAKGIKGVVGAQRPNYQSINTEVGQRWVPQGSQIPETETKMTVPEGAFAAQPVYGKELFPDQAALLKRKAAGMSLAEVLAQASGVTLQPNAYVSGVKAGNAPSININKPAPKTDRSGWYSFWGSEGYTPTLDERTQAINVYMKQNPGVSERMAKRNFDKMKQTDQLIYYKEMRRNPSRAKTEGAKGKFKW